MTAEEERRKAWYQAHADRRLDDHETIDEQLKWRFDTEACAAEAIEIFERLRQSRDLDAFKSELQAWSVKPTTIGFNGPTGQMFINQLMKADGDRAELARILADGMQLPDSDEHAAVKLSALVGYTNDVRTGGHPAPRNALFVLSYFWSIQDLSRWPVLWASSQGFLETSTGAKLPTDHVARYFEFARQIRELDQDAWSFATVARWWDKRKPVFLDSLVCDRCVQIGGVATESDALALVGYGVHVAKTMAPLVSDVLGRPVRAKYPQVRWTKTTWRGDTYADWWVQDKGGLGLRVWVNHDGAAIGIRVGRMKNNWPAIAAAEIEARPVDGYESLAAGRSITGRDVGFAGGSPGDFMYGRWFDREQLTDLDLAETLTQIATDLRPLLDHLDAVFKGGTVEEFSTDGDALAPVIKRFVEATGYPTASAENAISDRDHFAALLGRDQISSLDLSELVPIISTGRYGNPGPQSGLNATLNEASADERDAIIETLEFLLWGDGEDAARIDEVLQGSRKIRGLGESVIMKLLAITHPERYTPIYPWGGEMGKQRMLDLLDLIEPTGSRGEVHVKSNAAIIGRLNRFFPNDPLGMSQFCYWLSAQDGAEEAEEDDLESRLDDLADRLLVDRSFLAEIVELLEAKGQVILYGPPGTGKTYLARELSKVLAPDPQRRKIVQFHPSTSYEDFVEGFRPEATGNGDISYRLTPGPLALMAARAEQAPGSKHIMLIDEINRANLPKVFGELLFLLEYRDESITTLYRPDDPFKLPKDLLFIGTMNTADRSIALVDAALRRRFHFIPFFPHEGAMSGLLDRWLERHQPKSAWVGELVEMVNDELVRELGGPHLQIGPSYFMLEQELTEARLRTVWEYNIEPFIEDQLFGDQQRIDFFSFAKVLKRYRAQVGLDEDNPNQPTDSAPANS